MKTDFLHFYHRLEKDQRFEVIEFRLQFQKKIYKYIEFQCPVMAADLKELQERYLQRANPQTNSSANKQKNKNI